MMDEPTTGLDAATALALARLLASLAGDGRMVICSLHQPRPEIRALFHQCFEMSNGVVTATSSTVQSFANSDRALDSESHRDEGQPDKAKAANQAVHKQENSEDLPRGQEAGDANLEAASESEISAEGEANEAN